MGDSAATIDLGNSINDFLNDKIIAMQHWMQLHAFTGQKDIIVAYSSLTILYDPVLVKQHYRFSTTIFDWVRQQLQTAFEKSIVQLTAQQEVVRIPVCYAPAYGPDLNSMAAAKKLTTAEIIELHQSRIYRVYTIGFLPGFSYMAQVDDKLITPRKPQPAQVAAGSVGIAGAQTGIYPLDSPGGWHIIGRTPIKQFDAHDPSLVKLKAGDRVQFYAISEQEMEKQQM